MPTVRELKNRITFDVDKATVANAENTFGKLKKGAGSVITLVKGVGTAIIAVTGLASKQFIELEKDIGATNFFSRSKEDAAELLKLTKEIAKTSVTTSQKEGGQAAAILSQIPGIERFRKELLPILEEISIANPKLDFTGVTNAFSQLVKDGNLEELRNLLPGSAELLEKLGLSTFNFADRTKTAANRTQLFLEQISKVRPELKRLADEQKKTERFQSEGISKETSDFFTNFGTETAGPMTELFKEIRLTIKSLNENESFWKSVKSASETVLEAFKLVKSINFGASEEEKKKFSGDFYESVGLGFLPELLSGDIEKPAKRVTGQLKSEGLLKIPSNLSEARGSEFGSSEIPALEFFKTLIPSFGKPTPSGNNEASSQNGGQNFTLNGRIEVDVKGADNVNGGQLTDGITKTVTEVLKEKMRNVAAQNGRIVNNGGLPLGAR